MKYIIDLPDNCQWIQWIMLSDKDGHAYFHWKDREDLPLLDKELEEAYQRGLDDAWEVARKALRYTDYQRFVLFDKDNISDILTHFTASEVIEKVKKHEERQKVDDEIKVGDWVFNKYVGATSSAKVTFVDGQKVYMLCGDGSCGFADMANLEKTKVPNPKVEQLLETLKGELHKRNCSTCKWDDGNGVPQCTGCYASKGYNMWKPKGATE